MFTALPTTNSLVDDSHRRRLELENNEIRHQILWKGEKI